MKWLKLYTTLHRNVAFRRVSPTARLVFYVSLEIAGDLNQDGALYVRGVGAMTVEEIAIEVGVKAVHVEKALEELVAIGFLSKREDGAFMVERWAEMQAPADPTAADRKERQRRRSQAASQRDSGRTDHDSSPVHTRSQEAEEEVEEEKRVKKSGSGRPPCDCTTNRFATFPAWDVDVMVELVLDVFTGARKVDKRNHARPFHAALLRAIAAENYTPAQAWAAYSVVHHDCGHAPVPMTMNSFWAALRAMRGRLAVVPVGAAPKPIETVLAGLR